MNNGISNNKSARNRYVAKEIFPESTKWTIIAIGILAGLLWALPAGLHLQDRYAFYLPPLVLSAACVLAFTLYRLNAVKPGFVRC